MFSCHSCHLFFPSHQRSQNNVYNEILSCTITFKIDKRHVKAKPKPNQISILFKSAHYTNSFKLAFYPNCNEFKLAYY